MPGKYKINILSFLLLNASIFFFLQPVSAKAAASFYVEPNSGTFTVGNTFTVSIYLNTGGQDINAVEANLSFQPEKLQVVSPTTGKSFVQIWVTQPSYSNTEGTLKFQGALPSPGINTSAGLLSTITFRAKTIGIAALKFRDSSKVLLNDGRGTNILSQTTDGIFNLVLPPPGGPIVTSPTHPDQEKWYNTKDLIFQWSVDPDIQGYSYVLNDNPIDEPDNVAEGNNTNVAYKNLADGIHYFHIKALRQGSWGRTTNYAVKIDTTPPSAFKINFSPSDRTTNQRPLIDFSTTDALSGLDHYDLKIISLSVPAAKAAQDETPFFIEATPPYSKNLDYGKYDVIVRAFDRADNYFQTESSLVVAKPIFELIAGNGLRIGGIYTVPWVYFWIILGIIILTLAYIAKVVWKWHRSIEEQITHGPAEHPAVIDRLTKLKTKQKEYGDLKSIVVLILISSIAFILLGLNPAKSIAAQYNEKQKVDAAGGVPLDPPIITLFPKNSSNDELLYVGGKAYTQKAKVLIYLQNIDTGSTISESTVTDKDGSWFYSFPNFFDAGRYVVWTQLQVGNVLSPPSSRFDITVATTAVQIGSKRINFENFYLILLIVFAVVFIILLSWIIYHLYHLRKKKKYMSSMLKEAEESIRRGFVLVRRDIEAELSILHHAKLSQALSAEEKLREEKLIKDLEDVSQYVGEEIWRIEKNG